MRKAQIIGLVLLMAGTVGCSAQVPTMDEFATSGYSRKQPTNNGNFGDWDGSGNVTQANAAAVEVGDFSKVKVKQNNEAVGGASQQIGTGNNISSGGSGVVGGGSSSNNKNTGLWEDSGNTDQSNLAAIIAGKLSSVYLRQNNEASGATAQQIGDANNVSSKGQSKTPTKSTPKKKW